MKYIKPQLEKIELETDDIMLTSNEGTMTVGNITITGPQDEFSSDFNDLLGVF